MMKNDIHLLYEDLNQLLNDICEFLSDEIECDGISNRNLANDLIKRSKKQLEHISLMAPQPADGEYVIMNKSDVHNSDEKFENHYNDPEFPQPEIMIDDGNCPYINTPVNDLPHPEKNGFLERKEKFFFIGHQKRIYACVCDVWMLIYGSTKDQKPCDVFNLREHAVKTGDDQKDQKKTNDKAFELVSLKNSKLTQFTATTSKDMEQWVAAINRKKSTITHNAEEQPEEIYERIEHDDHLNSIEEIQRKIPPPPPRRTQNEIKRKTTHLSEDYDETYDVIATNKSIDQSNPTIDESKHEDELDEDSGDLYEALIPDVIQTNPKSSRTTSSRTSSFSEDDDMIYDQLALPFAFAPTKPTHRNDEQEVYDEIQPRDEFSKDSGKSTDDDDEQVVYDVIQAQPHEENKNVQMKDNVNLQIKKSPFLPIIKPKLFPKPSKKN